MGNSRSYHRIARWPGWPVRGEGAERLLASLDVAPVVPGSRAHFRAFEILPGQPDLDLPPFAVGALVGGGVAEAVAAGDLLLDALVHLVHFLDARREHGLPPGHLGKPLQTLTLLQA